MSCNCSCSYNNLPCCCPTAEEIICPTTVCPNAQPCEEVVESDCVLYTGNDYECADIEKGMTVTQVIKVIINSLNLNCTTTTTSTTSTTSTTTTSTTSTTSTTTTTTIFPGKIACSSIPLTVNCNCIYQVFDTSLYSTFINPPAPSCNPSGYLGGDIWFNVVVPASGELLISTEALQITDGAFSVYSGGCLNLTEIICVDDNQGLLMPATHLTGLNPGDTLIIRFWGFGGSLTNQIGTFKICANDPGCCQPLEITGFADACFAPTTTSTTSTTTSTTSTTTIAPLSSTTTSTTSTSTTSTTSTTTTTTQCPCNIYLLTGNTPVVLFSFVECGASNESNVPLGFGQTAIYCIDNAQGISVSGDGAYNQVDAECCTPSSITTTSSTTTTSTTTTTTNSLNFEISNQTSFGKIESVTPVFYTTVTTIAETSYGTQSGYIGVVNVTINDSNPGTVTLYINGGTFECITTTGSGTYSFSPVVINPGDLVNIIYGYGICL